MDIEEKIKLVTDTLFSFSTVPIKLVTAIGSLSIVGAVLWSMLIIYEKINSNIDVDGWTASILFNLISFGVIMLSLGILGEHVWRMFDSSRKRPTYIVEEEYSLDDKKTE